MTPTLAEREEPASAGAGRVLIVTTEVIGDRMAGPGIRAWEMSKHLGKRHEARLLGMIAEERAGSTQAQALSRSTLRANLEWAEVIVFQGPVLHRYPEVVTSGKVLVADLYDPFHLENLELFRTEAPEARSSTAEFDLEVINDQLTLCDFFICASEKQRDFWLGHLAALGRINPRAYDSDPTLRKLIDVVPFGTPEHPPSSERRVVKGVIPGIGESDNLILWAGGIYNWLDPLTLIKAVEVLRPAHPEVRLLFMGLDHPNPDVPEMKMAVEAVSLAKELGLAGVHVFFNQGWVPYEQRAGYLLEADVGVSCHLDHIETAYSYRTRVLDYFWAGVPVVVSSGDALADLVTRESLGIAVEPGDVEGLASALTRMIEDEAFANGCRLNQESLRPSLTWPRALRALDEFCANPQPAPDRIGMKRKTFRGYVPRRRPLRLVGRAVHYWRKGGLWLLAGQTRRYFARLTRQYLGR